MREVNQQGAEDPSELGRLQEAPTPGDSVMLDHPRAHMLLALEHLQGYQDGSDLAGC